MNLSKYLHTDELAVLCNKIKMPEEVSARVLDLSRTFDFSGFDEYADQLFDCTTAPAGVRAIEERICGRMDSMFVRLTIWLGCVLHTQELYSCKGIDDRVFYDTMGCFSRFVNEYKVSYGVYGFDNSIWTYRMTAMTLFRLGELEFEMVDYQGPDLVIGGIKVLSHGEHVLYVHIPSDSHLEGENCHEAYRMAQAFFSMFYPEYVYTLFYTNTWLLSPNLRLLLPEGSKILNFQKDYLICMVDEECTGYIERVFKNSAFEPSCYPENTSLQRKMKKHVLAGGKIGTAAGIIQKH